MNKIINEMEQLLLKYKHGNGNDIYEQGKQEKKNESHTFVLNLSERLNLRSSNKLVTFQNLSIYYQWKNIRKIYKNNNFKIIAPAWNADSNYQIVVILCQIFKIISNISLKNMKQ